MTDSTTVGQLTLVPSYETIGVYSSFTGDDNNNNHTVLRYRPAGGIWKQGVELYKDTRAELIQVGLAGEPIEGPYSVPNPYKNQYRGVIFGLAPNTDYQVEVAYTDPDGVSGTAQGMVRTLDDNPPSDGNSYWVDPVKGNDNNPGTEELPWATVQHAANIIQAGDTVNISGTITEPGSAYAGRGVQVWASGTPDNYITFQSADPNNRVVIDGQGARWFAFQLLGSYIRIRNLVMTNFNGDPGGPVFIGPKGDAGDELAVGNIVEDCDISNPGGHWGCAGILIRYSEGSLIQNNEIYATPYGDRAPNYGIFFYGTLGRNVVRNNDIHSDASFKDSIGGIANFSIEGGPGPDSSIYNNNIYGSWDDGIEVEGGNCNVAVWGNTIKNNDVDIGGASMNMGVGMSSTIVGPLYVMRNVIINPGDATFKIGTHSFGPMYIYHNTIYGDQGGAGIGHFGNDAIAENYSVLNNIFYLSGGGRCVENWYNQFTAGNNWWPIPGSAAGIVYDGNCWWTTRNEGHFAVAWLRNPNGDGSSWTHELPGSWQTALGFDIHGIVAEPLFENPVTGDFRLKAASPCADAGVIIPGINDSDSPWPYSGAAPDIGAIESGGVITHPMASFEASPMEGPVPLTVNFINHSTGTIDSYLWDFRDGHTSVEINPTHSFLAEGTYEVLLTVTGPGGQHSASRTITVFGQVINYSLTIQAATGGSTSPTAGNYSYPAGTQVPVSAIPNNGYSFDHWNLNGTDYDDNPIRVLLNNDSTLLPIFVKIPADYSVTITALAGGTTEPAPGTYEVTEGETFTVDAIPNSGYKFDHWEGDISSSQSHLSFAVSGNMNLIAVFKVLVAPPVPGFTASPSSGTAPLAVQLANQSTGNITDYYWDFGDGSPISMIVSPIHTFQSVGNYNVTLTVTGPGGSRSTSRVITVTAPPATYDLTILEAQGGSTRPVSGTYSYAENSSVDITAIPLSGYTFSHWLLNANEYTDNPLTIQMSADATLQAVFEEVVNPPEEYSLVITAMPGGITDPNPGTFSIIEGTQVVIEAIPDSGYIFDHWEGDISGVDNLTVFFMDSNKSIIAVFTQKPGTGGFALAASAAIVGVIAIAATKHKGAGR